MQHFGKVCWLGTSTRDKSKQGCWTCATTVLLSIISVVGSARLLFYRLKMRQPRVCF